tara:strand:+ start:121 stop:318 length:198 start_codon:yes stop_codon:yes gene_type:complete
MFIFLTGCIQSSAMLGSIIGIGTTGNVQRTIISQSINYSVKQKTGKNINEHALSSFNKEFKNTTQ